MGFLDDAKRAADKLATKADEAISGATSGGTAGPPPEKCFRDLGMLAYLHATGRSYPAPEWERLVNALRDAEGRGPLNFTLTTLQPPPPPPPPAGAGTPATPPPVATPSSSAPTPPPPPPPSWASTEDDKQPG